MPEEPRALLVWLSGWGDGVSHILICDGLLFGSGVPKVLKLNLLSEQCGAFKNTSNRVPIIYKEHLCTNKRSGGSAGT